MLDKNTSICLVANPTAGQGRAKRIAVIAQREFQQLGYNASLKFTGGPGQGVAIAQEYALNGCGVIVAVGGDGTISEAINGIVGTKTLLGIVPAGTANDFVKELGLPLDTSSAVKVILGGVTKRIDLGRISASKYFINMAGIGFDATVIENLNQTLKRWLKDAVYVIAAVKTLIRYKTPLLTIEADDRRYKGSFVVIGNNRFYGGILSITTKAKMNDGYLDVCIFQGAKKRTLYKYLIGVVTRTHLSFKDVVYLKAREVTVTSDRDTPVQVDGDIAGKLPMIFKVAPEVLDVIVAEQPARISGDDRVYVGLGRQ